MGNDLEPLGGQIIKSLRVEVNSLPSASCKLNTAMSSCRWAQILESSCRKDPAAAFRGLAIKGLPSSSRLALMLSNTDRAM